MKIVKDQKGFLTGLLFLGIATVFGVSLANLPIGSATNMGPGYFPLTLIIVLVLLSAVLLFNSLRIQGEAISKFSWKTALIVLPIVFVASTLQTLGLLPAIAIGVFASTYADPNRRLVVSLVISATVAGLCWAIFVWSLGLPIPSFSTWILRALTWT